MEVLVIGVGTISNWKSISKRLEGHNYINIIYPSVKILQQPK